MQHPKKMSGVVMTGHGDFDKLVWRDDLSVPELGRQDVLIKVTAAGVNNTDINTRLAWYSKSGTESEDASWSSKPLTFPRIQGADICGHIIAVGANVDPSRIGTRVIVEPCLREADDTVLDSPWYIGSECDGGFAQYTRVASRHAYTINSNLTDRELASFPCSYSTAENMLTRAHVTQADTVLITGASGGVGSAVVQLARARGAKIIAVTSKAKAKGLLELGAGETLDRHDDYTARLGTDSVDVVIDLVAGPKFPSLLEVLKPFGRYAVAGAIAGPLVELDVRTLYLKDHSFYGCTVLEPEVFGTLVQRIERHEIKPLVAQHFALRDIVKAQKAFLTKAHIGKIVLDV